MRLGFHDVLPHLKTMWNSHKNPIGALVTEESRKELWGAMCAEREGADLGDTAVYPVSNIKENRWVVMAWNGEVRRFEQGTRLEHSQWEEDSEREGVRGYLGLWVEGHHIKEEGQADFPSKTISVKV